MDIAVTLIILAVSFLVQAALSKKLVAHMDEGNPRATWSRAFSAAGICHGVMFAVGMEIPDQTMALRIIGLVVQITTYVAIFRIGPGLAFAVGLLSSLIVAAVGIAGAAVVGVLWSVSPWLLLGAAVIAVGLFVARELLVRDFKRRLDAVE